MHISHTTRATYLVSFYLSPTPYHTHPPPPRLLAQAEGVLRSSTHHNHSYPPLHATYRAMGQGLASGHEDNNSPGGMSGVGGGVMNRPALVARQESQRLVGQALELLRNAYHLHWGASYMRPLLSR